MTTELRVLIDDSEIGTIEKTRSGRLQFTYDDNWRSSPEAIPLSLSMPMTAAVHGDSAISPYLWGLLPDSDATLERIGKTYGVSQRNPFALLSHIGEDLQGAVQTVPIEKVSELKQREGVTFLSREVLAERFRELMRDPGATKFAEDGGKFSLAGAQRKMTLYRVNQRWGVPRGRTPSTHILKPSIQGFAGQAQNEMFCLRLAPRLDLPAPPCWIELFGELPVIVIQRYDRQRFRGKNVVKLTESGGEVKRAHQEDTCQALKVLPANKYQREGGPGILQIMGLLSGSSEPSTDRDRFMRACAYNYVIAATDAHAKNYSILLTNGGRYRLAPLYDIASWLPYSKGHNDRKLAMSVDGHYDYDTIQPRYWEATARKVGFDSSRMLAHIRDILARIVAEATKLLEVCKGEGVADVDLENLVKVLIERAGKLRIIYGSEKMREPGGQLEFPLEKN
jgi:serine/threonine-protein kinase HipA